MKRYDPIEYFQQGGSAYGSMKEKPDGDYVKWDDAKNLIDTVEACLVAAGGSPVLELLEIQCKETGAKPSDFVKALKRRKDNLERLLESVYHHVGDDSTFTEWVKTMLLNIEETGGTHE